MSRIEFDAIRTKKFDPVIMDMRAVRTLAEDVTEQNAVRAGTAAAQAIRANHAEKRRLRANARPQDKVSRLHATAAKADRV